MAYPWTNMHNYYPFFSLLHSSWYPPVSFTLDSRFPRTAWTQNHSVLLFLFFYCATPHKQETIQKTKHKNPKHLLLSVWARKQYFLNNWKYAKLTLSGRNILGENSHLELVLLYLPLESFVVCWGFCGVCLWFFVFLLLLIKPPHF